MKFLNLFSFKGFTNSLFLVMKFCLRLTVLRIFSQNKVRILIETTLRIRDVFLNSDSVRLVHNTDFPDENHETHA